VDGLGDHSFPVPLSPLIKTVMSVSRHLVHHRWTTPSLRHADEKLVIPSSGYLRAQLHESHFAWVFSEDQSLTMRKKLLPVETRLLI
jgi:hypothetical protein